MEGGVEKASARGLDVSRDQWTKFIAHCIVKRLDTDKFESYVGFLHPKHPLPPAIIADILLRPQPHNRQSLDPRIPHYLKVLSRRHLVDVPSTLNALYRYSTGHTRVHNATAGSETSSWASSYKWEETLFYWLANSVHSGAAFRSASEALRTCQATAKWMTLFTSVSAAFAQDVMGQIQDPRARHELEEMEGARAAFVFLFLETCQEQSVLKALSHPSAKGMRRALSDGIAAFAPVIFSSTSQAAARMELFRTETLASFEPVGKKKEADNPEMDDIESSMALDNIVVTEIPVTNSRAGLYIYLNACLVGRPLIDDAALFNYLHNRFQGDIQTTAIDLVLASFDVLANVVFRNEGQKTGHLLRSYLINKVPLLLSSLSKLMLPPLTAQYCITEALAQVDTNAFPTLSAMFDDTSNNNTFTDSVRQDFCFACCLHGLIPEESIEGLLGEITYQTLPQGGRYVKETLVDRCLDDPERTQSLIGELDNMDGNVGAVCQALIEIIGRLCHNKETMSLKLLCSQLAKKPLSLDVMLLFGKPQAILQPLCELLDNWRYEEDQGEYQPVYEEFGASLLLVLAFVFRYNLSASDLGIRSQDSFVARLLNQCSLSGSLDKWTDQQKDQLSGWILGLFDTDAGGLGDELMSSCPPQDFYLLMPTLTHQIVLASETGFLSEESLKTGIEYLVDPFLLPSLVVAITYMSNQMWLERQQEQNMMIRILQLILLTKQGSDEAQSMLSAVLNIVAKPLEHSLRLYQRQDPKSQEIEPLLNAIKENTRLSRRTAGAGHNELEMWTSTANGGLAASVRHTIQGFVQWSLHPGINIMPTSYTHRQILTALKMHGAKRLLHVIVDEVKQHQMDESSASIAHDVATALICAPDVTNDYSPPPPNMAVLADPSLHHAPPPPPPQTRTSLRAALKAEAESQAALQKKTTNTTTTEVDRVAAEMLVRLHRRVEAQLATPQDDADRAAAAAAATEQAMLQGQLGAALAAAQQQGGDVGVGGAGGGPLDLDLSGVAADAAGGMVVGVGVGDDMAGGMGGGMMGGDAAANAPVGGGGGLGFGVDDDVFGTAGGSDLLEGWDGMDMS
ncbi:mediator complex subunit Med5 [Xylariaceae sp. FL0804]|nr:mediator complex subunit Med5 [Xylariaceae sp. FL0804]